MRKNCKRQIKSQESEVRSQENGFTLLELIVAMTILSLVAVLIGSGFRLALDSWKKGETETDWTQRLRVLSGNMSRQLKSAYPYKMKVDDETKVLFEGDSDSVIFASAFNDQSYGGFKWIRYSYKDGDFLYKEGLLPDKELTEKISGKEEIIDSDLEEVRFEYFSSEDDEWKESWDSEDGLPGAVRVKISYFDPFYISIPMGMKKKDENDG